MEQIEDKSMWEIAMCNGSEKKQENVGRAEENNQVIMSGVADSAFTHDHSIIGEKFYRIEMLVCRRSGRYDRIPLIISEKLMDTRRDIRGMFMRVEGQFRSFNRVEEGRRRLILTVFVQRIMSISSGTCSQRPVNNIFLEGYLSKKPYYRVTPRGIKITEILMAVNRRNSSDYIPCICWEKNASEAAKLNQGDKLRLWGRIQSRIYAKKMPGPGGFSTVYRTAYEMSVGKMEAAVAL